MVIESKENFVTDCSDDTKTDVDFKIGIPHFYCLEYKEGKKEMLVDIDFREHEIVLSLKLIRGWVKPYDSISLEDKDKKRIITNIRDYLIKDRSPERVWIED